MYLNFHNKNLKVFEIMLKKFLSYLIKGLSSVDVINDNDISEAMEKLTLSIHKYLLSINYVACIVLDIGPIFALKELTGHSRQNEIT